ncbi:carbonyl reductase [Agrilactobacillus composti DSM 18527 = JCM 14202]|uniref:Carbonyl reductase n=1 Tax=Agrilactobacillus composti DSM 18527 = JCM 14202 TaxID=1423734 RepID=X0PGT3_9LACO|nr:SDR family NAD(P)-dependent oxidoreductase [Agrilactobacillus composti]KRM31869.1 carbonyl reductase [Agrilactobacillus composti DSM 18527 = JCM 14202]GAF41274.1 short chain dehydrogenase [Agrilactobacillus composti DSM 18527 = JCM 14202]
MTKTATITLITGANRGMGLEIAEELAQKGQQVILGSRDLQKGQAAQKQLAAANISVDVLQLDVTDPTSVRQAAAAITNKYGYLSILINNAGAVFDAQKKPSEILQSALRADFDLNYFGLIDVTQQLLPLLKKTPQAKIINISSMMGSITNALNPKSEVYRASAVGYQSSKAALNMYTVQLAKELQQAGLPITVNAIDPGMVATEFGGVTPDQAKAMGAKPVDFGVAQTVALATDPDNQSTATFTNTHGPVAW